ncbi:alpha/beta-hydrolase [Didymella exigua CBS 183.55]|uniref:Alpha/beta-hydrolase n=1 Tax=Didymella exigua CBS 183.55 TaxID=1150837 RepID=A0A6A5R8Y7_9PLEO|nr:alpha/beta-hydrolase [Didymella exigua CBS 183.55]KAF1923126.1 alpha/beta-hydrolase [Didymella exigua CBS 183.55]
MAEHHRRPPFDQSYKNASGFPNPDRTFDIRKIRQGMQVARTNASSIARKHPQYTHTDLLIPGIPGSSNSPITLALWQLPYSSSPEQKKWPNGRSVIYHIHGGGQIAGDRFLGLESVVSHFEPQENIVFASPEYRLAPEHRAPAAAYDVYAGLVYLVENAKELNINPSKIVLYGISGGAALAASAALLSRKIGGPRYCALVLDIPMLDDRGSVSREQFDDGTVWQGWMDVKAWDAVLGDGDRNDGDGIRVAGRAEDLSGLPDVFIDIGACESMRDSAVAFASRVWKDGGRAELHVWPGVYHGGAMFEPDVPVSKEMTRTQRGFLQRVLGLGEDDRNNDGKAKAKAML